MKKNGFIATSLIYSFFLIFITLFLTIIADYLQNKILLNTIEKGIKDEINDSIGIRDFEVGDMIGFISDCDSINEELNDAPLYTIANVIINNNAKCENKGNSCLILYGVELANSYIDTVDYVDIINDIDYGYRNNTYYNKIIYSFGMNNEISFDLGSGYTAYKNYSGCTLSDNYFTNNSCIIQDNLSNGKYRERYILLENEETNNRFKKCATSDGTNTIYVEYSK